MVFNKKKIYLMGILNITPDSFSDGGLYNSTSSALKMAEKMIKDGADIIDIGGESTRPFSEPITVNEELDKVIPVIEKIGKNFDIPISIDTYKSEVANEALKNGATIINDISGFTFDKDMENIALKHNATVVIMHIKGTPKDMQINPTYNDVVSEVYEFLNEKATHLKNIGLKEVVIDVGFGFGKSLDDNYVLLNNLDKFVSINSPILVGLSRKSLIGKVIESLPQERVSGTVALNTVAILKGARIVRCHDVKENYQAIKVLEKYLSLG